MSLEAEARDVATSEVKLLHSLYLGLSPLPVIVEMKVYRDSLLKM